MSDNHGTQALWPQMIAALAAIDEELGLPQDGCNSTAQTLDAIRQLRADTQEVQAARIFLREKDRLLRMLAESQAQAQRLRETVDSCRQWFEFRVTGKATGGSTSSMLSACSVAMLANSDDSTLREMIAAAKAEEREMCLACYSPDDTATDWADKIRARKIEPSNSY